MPQNRHGTGIKDSGGDHRPIRSSPKRVLGENTDGNTERPDPKSRKKSELWTPGIAVFGGRSLLHQVASRAIAHRKRYRLRTGGELAEKGCQEASDCADDSIARFGTLLLRVRALSERADASEQAWNRR
jgi:hypothetical protein